jgi:hypothetical protein
MILISLAGIKVKPKAFYINREIFEVSSSKLVIIEVIVLILLPYILSFGNLGFKII